MLAAFSVAPSTPADPTGSVHHAVARAVKIVRESGLPNETTSMFTTIEGEWDQIFAVIKQATEAVEEFSDRVSLVIKCDIRRGYDANQLTEKVQRVEDDLAAE
ncbi:MAG: thiamine-binding protein [Pseudoclavibacter sp.]|jgi:uncharacterized protein (TIGR00106 family)